MSRIDQVDQLVIAAIHLIDARSILSNQDSYSEPDMVSYFLNSENNPSDYSLGMIQKFEQTLQSTQEQISEANLFETDVEKKFIQLISQVTAASRKTKAWKLDQRSDEWDFYTDLSKNTVFFKRYFKDFLNSLEVLILNNAKEIDNYLEISENLIEKWEKGLTSLLPLNLINQELIFYIKKI